MATRARTRGLPLRAPQAAPDGSSATFAVLLLTGLLLTLAGWIAWRAVGGSFQRALPAGGLLGIAAAMSVLLLAVDRACRRFAEFRGSAGLGLLATVGLLAVVTVGSLAVAGGVLGGAGLLAMFLVATASALVARQELQALLRLGPAPSIVSATDNRPLTATTDAADAARVVQQFTRRCDAEGRESIEGTFVAVLERGQRTVQFHLAFCPPLAETPRLEIIQIAGPAARWKIASAWPFAARIEGKLAAPNPSQGTEVTIRLLGESQQAGQQSEASQ